MDIQLIASQTVQWISPFLPYLVKGGIEAAKAAAKKLGEKFTEKTWENAETIWGKLKPGLEAKSAAKEAIQDAGKNPQDGDTLAALRVQIKKLIEEDAELAEALKSFIENEPIPTQRIEINQKAGDHAIQVGTARDIHIRPKDD
jgi:hypothetical protein